MTALLLEAVDERYISLECSNPRKEMKRYIFTAFVALLLLMPLTASARLMAIRDSVSNGYNFWLYVPKQYKDHRADRAKMLAASAEQTDSVAVDKTKVPAGLPVIVFLHGRSLSGTDLNKVRKYGTIDAISRGRKINAIVIAPQVTMTDWWRPNRVMNIVKWVSERYDVDLSRLYVLGMSLGGYGAINFAAAYPNETAAAMGLCGGGSEKKLTNINKVPMWIIHGTADAAVPVSESRRVKVAMEAGDPTTPRLRYDEYVGVEHAPLARLFYLKETYEWLFKHSTTDPSRPVDRTVVIKPEYAVNRSYVYQGLHRGSGNLKIYDPLMGAKLPSIAKKMPYNGTPAVSAGTTSTSDATSAKTEDTAVAKKSTSTNKANTSTKGATSTKSASQAVKTHVVQSGETISHLAVKYNTTTKKILELNPGLNPDKVKIGQKIRVKPGSASKQSTPKQQAVYHTMLSGETISHLAVKYGTTTKKIQALNPGLNPDKVRDGQKIRVK